MKATVSRMQGTPASIEFHYEALAYCKREKKICHFMESKSCGNIDSPNFRGGCIGYNKCTEFTSEDRYCDKVGRAARKEQKRKKNKVTAYSKSVHVKEVSMISENALGNDPRFAALFNQFRGDGEH